MLLPDDDGLYPGHLAAAVELLERFETVGLAHTAWDHIDARSRVIRRVDPLMSRTPARIDTRDRALEWLMVSSEGPCFPSIAYRTKAIVGAGGFREEQEPFSDRQMWMRIALEWDFGYIAQPLARFRTHPETIGASIVTQNGSTLDERERSRRFSQINFQRRIDFLREAPLDPAESETPPRVRHAPAPGRKRQTWDFPGTRRQPAWRTSCGRIRNHAAPDALAPRGGTARREARAFSTPQGGLRLDGGQP